MVHEDERPLEYLCDRSRHLVCVPYSVENLHRMADDLGIKRCWFHRGTYPHYDIPKRRVDEVTSRCRVVTSRELLLTVRERPGMMDNEIVSGDEDVGGGTASEP